MSNRKPQGVILYRGPSLLNGEPIMCVATNLSRGSRNGKTGKVIQVYILADTRRTPIQTIAAGADASICGDCPHRPRNGFGTCYVNALRGPQGVYYAFKARLYPRYRAEKHLELFRGRIIRLGAYGDPAAVPFEVWAEVCGVARARIGYTHAWRYCDQRLAQLTMASVETETQAREAWQAGWRTFRVRTAEDLVLPGEFVCPASKEAGKRLTCEECRACSGAKSGGKNVSPTIIVHGPPNKRAVYLRHVLPAIKAAEAGRLSLTIL